MNIFDLPTLDIRRLAASDTAPAAKLMHKVWHDTYRSQLPADLRSQRTEDHFADYLAARTNRTWTAWMGKRIAAVATLSINNIDDLWVAERYRRRGVATRMVCTAMDHLVERGFTHIQAGCENFNEEALAFFDALGWRRIGSEPLHLVPGRAIDAVVFSRQLTGIAAAGQK